MGSIWLRQEYKSELDAKRISYWNNTKRIQLEPNLYPDRKLGQWFNRWNKDEIPINLLRVAQNCTLVTVWPQLLAFYGSWLEPRIRSRKQQFNWRHGSPDDLEPGASMYSPSPLRIVRETHKYSLHAPSLCQYFLIQLKKTNFCAGYTRGKLWIWLISLGLD